MTAGRRCVWPAILTLALCAASADDPEVLVRDIVAGPGLRADRAAERLRFLGPERAGPLLRPLLSNPQARVREAASAALVVVRDRASEPALRLCLDDEDWEVRRNCAQALGNLRSRPAGSALARHLEADSNVRVRKACATALGETGARGEALAKAARRDAELEVRLAALDALAKSPGLRESGSEKVDAMLQALLSDASEMVRFGAARALAWRGAAAGRTFLAGAVRGADGEKSRRAVSILADVPNPWAGELLAGASASPDADTRFEAARALARRGDARGRAALHAMAGERGASADAVRARKALESLGDSDVARPVP